jgi:hypothetical protein
VAHLDSVYLGPHWFGGEPCCVVVCLVAVGAYYIGCLTHIWSIKFRLKNN